MADLLALKNAVVAGLVKTVRIPLVPDALAVKLYGALIERVWSLLPSAVQHAIGTASQFIEPDQVGHVLKSLTALLMTHLPRVMPWLGHDEVVDLSQSVARTLVSMSAQNATASAFTAPAQSPE